MSKVAIIGPENAVIGFKAFGFETFFSDNKDQAKEHLTAILDTKEYAIIFITAKLAHEIPEEINNASKFLSITILPTSKKEEALADEHLKTISEKATGVNIWDKLMEVKLFWQEK